MYYPRCSTFVYFETYLLYSILDYGRHSVEKIATWACDAFKLCPAGIAWCEATRQKFTPKISFVTLIPFYLIIYDVSLENLEWINQ